MRNAGVGPARVATYGADAQGAESNQVARHQRVARHPAWADERMLPRTAARTLADFRCCRAYSRLQQELATADGAKLSVLGPAFSALELGAAKIKH